MTIVMRMAKKRASLVGAHEIRDLLGGQLSRQRVYQLTSRANFPAPIADLAQGKVWLALEVRRWITNRRGPSIGVEE